MSSEKEEIEKKTQDFTVQEVKSDGLDQSSFEVPLDFKQRILKALGHDPSTFEEEEFPPDIAYMVNQISHLEIENALEILKKTAVEMQTDRNFPADVLQLIGELLEKDTNECTPEEAYDWAQECKIQAGLIYFHSPYPEVRGVTSPVNDEDEPIETIRSYVLGLLWTIIGAGVNEFFRHRQPHITLVSSVMQVLLFPCGKFCEYVLPKWEFRFRGRRFSLNPGPWSSKEQMFSTLLFNVAGRSTYVSYNIYVQKLDRFYGNKWCDFGYQVLLMLSSNFMGFGFAGLMRKFVVYNEKCIWPTLMPTVALNRALLAKENGKEVIHGWKLTKYKFFVILFVGMFLYFWIPNYLFQALSTFNWMTWIKPENFNLAMITGSNYGLGLNPIPTFDWNIIDFNYCITIPFYSQFNQYIGTLIGFFVIVGLYYSNYKWTAFLPMNDNNIFTNTGESYEVSQILDSSSKLVESKYQNYSPPFYSAGNLLVYGAFMAIYPFSFVYTVLTEWESMKYGAELVWSQIKNFKLNGSGYDGFEDPHTRIMKKYKEVPDYYFFTVMIISIVLGILCVELYPTETPVWGIFFVLAFNLVFLVPILLIYSITGFSFGLNVIIEIIIGYALPGNPIAMMTLKALGYNIDGQAESFISDHKLAHYTRIPQIAMFRGQMIAVFVQSFVALGVINWQLVNVDNICTPQAENNFTCPDEVTFYSASVLWGVIGPKKIFNGLYPIFKWSFLIGFLLSLVCVAIKKAFPRKAKYFEPTLIIGGMLQYAPYNLSYLTGGLYMSFFSMYYLKKRYPAWWDKYNYVMAAAFSAGVAFSSIIIFFSVKYHPKKIVWWGNTVSNGGIEGGLGQQMLKNVTLDAPDGYFGPRVGSFP